MRLIRGLETTSLDTAGCLTQVQGQPLQSTSQGDCARPKSVTGLGNDRLEQHWPRILIPQQPNFKDEINKKTRKPGPEEWPGAKDGTEKGLRAEKRFGERAPDLHTSRVPEV